MQLSFIRIGELNDVYFVYDDRYDKNYGVCLYFLKCSQVYYRYIDSIESELKVLEWRLVVKLGLKLYYRCQKIRLIFVFVNFMKQLYRIVILRL